MMVQARTSASWVLCTLIVTPWQETTFKGVDEGNMESRKVRIGAMRHHFWGFLRSGALCRFGNSGLADRAGCKPRFFAARVRGPHRPILASLIRF